MFDGFIFIFGFSWDFLAKSFFLRISLPSLLPRALFFVCSSCLCLVLRAHCRSLFNARVRCSTLVIVCVLTCSVLVIICFSVLNVCLHSCAHMLNVHVFKCQALCDSPCPKLVHFQHSPRQILTTSIILLVQPCPP